MAYRDEMRVCEQCGKQFVFTVEEQRRQEQMGLEIAAPTLCKRCRESSSLQPGLHAGSIKWYSEEKAFGFLVQEDGSEVFFHRSGVSGDPDCVLQENTSVWYEVKQTDRGLQAYNVHERE